MSPCCASGSGGWVGAASGIKLRSGITSWDALGHRLLMAESIHKSHKSLWRGSYLAGWNSSRKGLMRNLMKPRLRLLLGGWPSDKKRKNVLHTVLNNSRAKTKLFSGRKSECHKPPSHELPAMSCASSWLWCQRRRIWEISWALSLMYC